MQLRNNLLFFDPVENPLWCLMRWGFTVGHLSLSEAPSHINLSQCFPHQGKVPSICVRVEQAPSLWMSELQGKAQARHSALGSTAQPAESNQQQAGGRTLYPIEVSLGLFLPDHLEWLVSRRNINTAEAVYRGAGNTALEKCFSACWHLGRVALQAPFHRWCGL